MAPVISLRSDLSSLLTTAPQPAIVLRLFAARPKSSNFAK